MLELGADGIPLAIVTGVLGAVVTVLVQWLKGRNALDAAKVSSGVKVGELRDKLMLDLLEAAREEAHAARDLLVRTAHLEEALDHIHALLQSCGEPGEWKVAHRRATAFLRRMREEAQLADELRNSVQSARSQRFLNQRATGREEES